MAVTSRKNWRKKNWSLLKIKIKIIWTLIWNIIIIEILMSTPRKWKNRIQNPNMFMVNVTDGHILWRLKKNQKRKSHWKTFAILFELFNLSKSFTNCFIRGTTIEYIIWFWNESHKTVTFHMSNHIKLSHSYVGRPITKWHTLT